ncbi:MAG: hypothetical protein WD342_03940 [Verrucomicrobiales bacterium]
MNPRSLILHCLLALFVLALQPAHSQVSTRDVYQDGVRLFKQGDYAEALVRFETVLAHKPRDPYARSYATKCKTAIAQNLGPKNDLEGQLSKIVVPQMSFADAPLGDVLEYLSGRVEELSGGKLVANFIYKGTSEQRNNTLVTLSLRNVPITEAIRYVGQLADTRFTYEEHAIVADPNYRETANAAADAAGSEQSDGENTVFGEPAVNVFD